MQGRNTQLALRLRAICVGVAAGGFANSPHNDRTTAAPVAAVRNTILSDCQVSDNREPEYHLGLRQTRLAATNANSRPARASFHTERASGWRPEPAAEAGAPKDGTRGSGMASMTEGDCRLGIRLATDDMPISLGGSQQNCGRPSVGSLRCKARIRARAEDRSGKIEGLDRRRCESHQRDILPA
jgi:hypothetical protein